MGSRLTRNGIDKVYAAASQWVDCALKTDGSLFTPGKPIWSSELLAEVRRSVQDNPDTTDDKTFLEKLRGQLAGSSPEAHQLMAEALYVYYIAPVDVGHLTKANNINKVLEWSKQPKIQIPANLNEPLSYGIASFGFGRIHLPFSVGFLIEFAEQWKGQTHSDRNEMLKDPWAFKDFVMRLNFQSKLLEDSKLSQQREALLHLIFPDTFEAIVNADHKEQIARAFPDAVKDPNADVDRKLQQIRANLEQQIGAHDHLFDKPVIRGYWDDTASNCLQ